jgi:general secretion pathway protein A
MYTAYFGLSENPFSITPDPRFLYMSGRHREALAHLFYGLGASGGFVQLTGEIGTGKTTICRSLLRTLPKNVDVALILNPAMSVVELLRTICEELRIGVPRHGATPKDFIDRLNEYLLAANARGRKTVLIIDEAQNLDVDVLEQIRLLTNLETERHKLLQIFLIGQPELRELLGGENMQQLAQRITGRYHLGPLTRRETEQYIRHRLAVGGTQMPLFTRAAMRRIYRLSGGVPRTINILCDRALLGAFVTGREQVDRRIAVSASREVAGDIGARRFEVPAWARTAIAVSAAVAGTWMLATWWAQVTEFNAVAGIERPMRTEGTAREEAPSANAAAPSSRAERAAPAPRTGEPPAPSAVATAAVESAAEMPVTKAGPPAAPIEQPATQPAGLPAAQAPEAVSMAPPAPVAGVPQPMAQNVLAAFADHPWAREDIAATRLLALWHAEAGAGPLCERAERAALRCLRGVGSIADLRRLNRPAMLTLGDAEGREFYAVAEALDGARVTLDVGGLSVSCTVAEMEELWKGEYRLLWRPPLADVEVIGKTSPADAIRWLRRTLNEVQGFPPLDPGNGAFDWPLVKAVMQFQTRVGVKVDGTVGTDTFIALGSLLDPPGTPLLQQRRISFN